MIILKCDICKNELKDNQFLFEAVLKEVKQSLELKGTPMPNLIQRAIHLCRKCYEAKLNL